MDFSKLYDYDDIKFENKHVKILNEKKEIIFEDNIEFPINFDDNAAAIVASRYLCNNSKNKETSIKQMFNRVSDTITTWGCYNKYFDSDPDLKKADEFNSKLRYYQIHKYFAFNSPVYFNVGLQEAPQSSACFILSIEDNMESITEVSKLEAKIFKKGSGAGSNLSALRSSKEPVSGGGKASGPVSFLRSHDVLAGVVKCITQDSYIFTEYGLNKIENIIDPSISEGFHEIDTIRITDGDYNLKKPSKIFASGKEENIQKIKLDYTKLELKGTKEHPVLVLSNNFQLEWKNLKDIVIGDYVAVGRGFNIWSNIIPEFNFIPKLHHTIIQLTYPTKMTKELARILGYLVSEGHLDHRIGFSNADPDVLEDFTKCFKTVFGVEISNNFTETVNSKTNISTFELRLEWPGLIQFLDSIGFNSKISKTKTIPSSILCSPKEYVVEFLKAYFEGDGSISKTQIYSASVSLELSKQIQLLLLNFGIISSFKTVNVKNVDYYLVDIHGKEIDIFMKEIGFITNYKNDRYEYVLRNTNIDVVPYLNNILRNKGKQGYYKCKDGKTRKIKFETLNTRRNSSYDKIIETEMLTKLEIIDENIYQTLGYIQDKYYFWDKVTSNESCGKSKVFDFTIPDSHSFIANGIISHNSGGTLRRSAKLSCLNIDHPDIEEFIDCKLFEEEKLAILRNSGLSARAGYDLSDEVFFQNTNLSVRVTDDFMKKVETDSEWNTKFIKSEKICKTYKARNLLKKIAETSWKIADPGLQFHDTFNKWNTLANAGEIVATNP